MGLIGMIAQFLSMGWIIECMQTGMKKGDQPSDADILKDQRKNMESEKSISFQKLISSAF